MRIFNHPFGPFLWLIAVPSVIATTASTSTSSSTPTPSAPSKWIHPGAMISQPQLDFIRKQVKAKKQPWADAYDALLQDPAITDPKEPSPHAMVECGPYSKPDVGCAVERKDSIAAYANALAWAVGGSQEYARQAIKIMDAYASTVKGHNNSNAPLQAGWVGSVWARAGELIRYTDAGWSEDSIRQFESMLSDVYMPLTVNGTDHNVANWELVMTEAAILMAVFLEDADSYETAMGWFLKRVPATVYLTSDGEYPVAARGQSSSPDAIIDWWFGQSTFRVNGQAQETCRDLEHTGYSFASMAHVAETSRIQGTDLYSTDVGTRLRYGLEFHSQLVNDEDSVPSWLCGGSLNLTLGPVTELGYNGLSFRMGLEMPQTEKLTEDQRPAKDNGLFVAYETLTHAENKA